MPYQDLAPTDSLKVRVEYEVIEPGKQIEVLQWDRVYGTLSAFTHWYLETRNPGEDVPTFLAPLVIAELKKAEPDGLDYPHFHEHF